MYNYMEITIQSGKMVIFKGLSVRLNFGAIKIVRLSVSASVSNEYNSPKQRDFTIS